MRELSKDQRLGKGQARIRPDTALTQEKINSRHRHRVQTVGAGNGGRIAHRVDLGRNVLFLGIVILEHYE